MQEKLKNICTATGRMLMLLQIAILIMIKLPGKYRQDKKYSHLRQDYKISYLSFNQEEFKKKVRSQN